MGLFSEASAMAVQTIDDVISSLDEIVQQSYDKPAAWATLRRYTGG